MFDGSRLSLQENIDRTARIAELAHEADISCEGEIGFVGYSDGENQTARSIRSKNICKRYKSRRNGNIRWKRSFTKHKEGKLDLERIRLIEQVTSIPLVIHGGSECR